MNGLIFSASSGGLANRLRALIGYQALAECLNVPFYLHWEANEWCNAKFNDLFKVKVNLINSLDCERLSGDTQVKLYNNPVWFDQIWKDNTEASIPWLAFLEIVTRNLLDLEPQPSISSKIEAFEKQNDMTNSLGVHIRWTDNIKENSNREKNQVFFPEFVSNIEGFKKRIKFEVEDNPKIKIFLATDNPVIEYEIQKEFPGHILIYPKLFKNNKSRNIFKMGKNQRTIRATSIIDALIEIILLSNCREILGTYFSSYSKLSAIWGDKECYEVRGNEIAKCGYVQQLRLSQQLKKTNLGYTEN